MIFFEIRGRRCALPVASVRQVLASASVTPVPSAPTVVRGVTPVSGEALPVVDLGVWLAPGADIWHENPLRSTADKMLVIEAPSPTDGVTLRAALSVDRVTRLGSIDEETARRPPPPGPGFLAATVLDVDGPALLLDAAMAMEQIRNASRAAGRT